MKTINFFKYNATGNDFIVIDNRKNLYSAQDKNLWEKLCKNKSGIGADGVLLLENSEQADFKMRYINADGGEVEMCGNGARTITAFYHYVCETKKTNYQFETMNGHYNCMLDEVYGFKLRMTELRDWNQIDLSKFQIESPMRMYLNTGVPHCVFEVRDLDKLNVYEVGKKIRYDLDFKNGSNVNFFERTSSNQFKIRTYERGVEGETLSCGTGATATALAAASYYKISDEIILQTKGGILAVKFSSDFKEVYLCGKVEKIFEGIIEN